MKVTIRIKLLRQENNEWKVIKEDFIKEFNDECIDVNAFYQALEVFEKDIQDYDVIECDTGNRNVTQIINGQYLVR